MAASKKQLEYVNQRNREKCKRYTLVLNKDTQGDVVDYIQSHGAAQTTFVRAIRKLIELEEKENAK